MGKQTEKKKISSKKNYSFTLSTFHHWILGAKIDETVELEVAQRSLEANHLMINILRDRIQHYAGKKTYNSFTWDVLH